jgi:hypothetical protein
MRDPAENEDIEPSICSLRASLEDEQAIEQVYALIKSERRSGAPPQPLGRRRGRGQFAGFDCCWSRARMWEQYGEMHRGACLLSDRHRLECAVCGQWLADGHECAAHGAHGGCRKGMIDWLQPLQQALEAMQTRTADWSTPYARQLRDEVGRLRSRQSQLSAGSP